MTKTTLASLLDARDELNSLIDKWSHNAILASEAIRVLERVENDLLTARHNMEIHAGD